MVKIKHTRTAKHVETEIYLIKAVRYKLVFAQTAKEVSPAVCQLADYRAKSNNSNGRMDEQHFKVPQWV